MNAIPDFNGKRKNDGVRTFGETTVSFLKMTFAWFSNRHASGSADKASTSLRQVQTGEGFYGFDLDESKKIEFKKGRETPQLDENALAAMVHRDVPEYGELAEDVMDGDMDRCVLFEQAGTARKTLRQHLASLHRTQRRLSDPSLAAFPRFRWEFAVSPAGIVLLLLVALLLGGIAYLIHADWLVASRTFKESPLFDIPNPVDQNLPMVDPSDAFVAAFCLVPICLLTLSIKSFLHPPKIGVSSKRFLALSVIFFCLAATSTVGFGWIVGGHDSVILQCAGLQEAAPDTIAGIKVGKSTPPFEYVVALMLGLATGTSVLACYLPVLARPFFDVRHAVDVPKTRRQLAAINKAIAMTGDSLGVVNAFFKNYEAVGRGLGLTAESKVNASVNEELKTLRKRIRRLGFILLISVLIPMTSGCSDDVEAPKLGPHSPEATTGISVDPATPSSKPVEASVFFSEATESQPLRSYIEQWLTQGLPGGSRVSLYEGARHKHVISVDVPFGPPTVRVRNPRFQTALGQLEVYFSKRKTGMDDQINWPLVSDTVAGRNPKTRALNWIVLCGNPPYINATNPAFEFRDHWYAALGLVGAEKTPFAVNAKLQPGTLVSWFASSSQWGDSPAHRKGIINFQIAYWNEMGARLIEVSPDMAIAFKFAAPFSMPVKPEADERKAIMIDSKQEWKRNEPTESPEPKGLQTGREMVSLEKPGSLAYRVEMSGGKVSDLARTSLVLQIYIDKSGSMQARINSTVETLLYLARELPALVTSLEIGVIAANRDTKDVFDVQTIRSRDADGKRSYKALEKFLTSIDTNEGDYPSFDAIRENVQILHATGKGKRKFFLYLSDVVHAEGSLDEVKTMKAHILDGLGTWTQDETNDHRIIALYSGGPKTPNESTLPQPQQAAFIQEMVSVHPNGRMSTDSDVLIQEVIAATLPGVDLEMVIDSAND